MLIGIDANEANNKYRAGIGVYAFKLIENIYSYNLRKPRKNLLFRIYLSNPPCSDMPKETLWWRYEVFGQNGFWVEKNLMPKLWFEKLNKKIPDVFWSLTHYAPFPIPTKSAVSVMDLAYLKFPQYFKKSDYYKLKYWTQLSLRQADKIFTISEFSRKELYKYYPYSRNITAVIYPGIDKESFNKNIRNEKEKIGEIKRKYKFPENYLLYLGTAQPRKNLIKLIHAFSSIVRKRNDLHLVITGMVKEGRGGWMYDEIYESISNFRLQNKVILTGYLKFTDIPYLIAGSTGLVLPSLYEGFGIPVIEAMAVGTPVVISRNSSLTEAGGKVAIYLENPYNTDSIVSALAKLLTLPNEEKKKMIKDGFIHVEQYSWEKAAEKAVFELIKLGEKDDKR